VFHTRGTSWILVMTLLSYIIRTRINIDAIIDIYSKETPNVFSLFTCFRMVGIFCFEYSSTK
jgi:hypothetical protein